MSEDILQKIVRMRREDINRLGLNFNIDIPEARRVGHTEFLGNAGAILEVKRASPSKGDIAPDLNPVELATTYAEAHAQAVSVLTEMNFFKGTLRDLIAVADLMEHRRQQGLHTCAVLRKDFLLFEDEIDIAYRCGADAVLLIARILDDAQLVKMAERAQKFGIQAFVEVREADDFRKLAVVTAALGAAAFAVAGIDIQLQAVIAPMLIAAVGVFLSLLGIFLVRTKEGATMKDLLRSLSLGTNVSAVLIAIATFAILYLLGIENWLGLSFSVISGLAAGVIIGQATEYYTSHSYKPTQKISEAGQTGAATVIIKGIGTGMISTCIPVITIGVAIMLSYLCANGFDLSMSASSLSHGLYGIGIAAVGMLSTLGITLATDAYGPIADNAGGNAEMSQLGEEVRHRTDALDALGNTTAATGKGFAIGSAALTALALLASYIEEIKIAMARAGQTLTNVAGDVINATDATIPDFMNYFQVNLMNPKVIVGAFIGAMAAFLFCGMTMEAVGRAAEKMVQEVRRQFREIAGILEGTGTPDYGRCVEISTRAAQHEMVVPSVLAILIPIIVGVVLGVAGVLGLLVGGLAGGFTLAVFMANAGGAWDNAKKNIEEGNFGGKGSFAHKACIVGDTVGDPFKDTSGPSLNILIKLMSMVSIVMAGLTVAFA